MAKCETQIDRLRADIDSAIWTFRWIWLVNLAAVVWGLVVHHYDMALVAALSGTIAMVGIGRTRHDKRLLDRTASVCFGIRPKAGEGET